MRIREKEEKEVIERERKKEIDTKSDLILSLNLSLRRFTMTLADISTNKITRESSNA